jgi:general secretion pathway protein L
MPRFGFLIHWIDTLASLVERLREIWRGRRGLIVRREDEGFLIDSGETSTAPIVLTAAGALPEDILRRARGELILLDWPRERTVIRKITLPAQAQEFLSGIIRNQIERLSPWPVAQILYGFVAEPSRRAGNLDAHVLIALRGEIESARAQLADFGLAADRVIVGLEREAFASAAPVILWSRNGQRRHPDSRRLRFAIGGAIAGYVAICATVSLWAFTSAASLQSEGDDFADRARAIQRRVQAAKSPQAVAALSPPERAWVVKETSVSLVYLLETLSKALPDGAYLSELQLEANKLRVAGLADDAPPLIGALEKSAHFADVRFSAPTTRGPDGKLFRFSIEAQVAPRLATNGE